jgi:hypothetical protein
MTFISCFDRVASIADSGGALPLVSACVGCDQQNESIDLESFFPDVVSTAESMRQSWGSSSFPELSFMENSVGEGRQL